MPREKFRAPAAGAAEGNGSGMTQHREGWFTMLLL
jgi:hypothetical protein